MNRFKRGLSLLLAMVLLLSNLPMPVAHATAQCPAHTGHDAACGYSAAVAEVPCGHVCGENCPTEELTQCIHDHTASGCTYTEPSEARYCGHTCGDGTCGYKPAVAGVDCTCTPVPTHADSCASLGMGACDCTVTVTHGDTCASWAEGECDCAPTETHEESCASGRPGTCDCTVTLTHEDTCAPVEARAEVPCDFVHTDCGCAEAVTGGWDCGHVCSADNGCVKAVCTHTCPNDNCGYTAPKAASQCTHSCGVCQIQALIDELPGNVTQDNLDTVTAQLTAIDTAKAQLSDAELALVNFDRYQAAIASINELQNQPGAQEPELLATSGSCGETVQWELDESTGTLTIFGTGKMKDYCHIATIFDESYISDYLTLPYSMSSVKKVVVESGVTSIGGYAFGFYSGSSPVTQVTLADTVKTIGAAAFMNCSALSELTIPASVTSIGMEAFTGCGTISVTFSGNAPSIGDDAFLNTTATCYYPADDTTWTESVRGQYGGSVTWVPYGGHTHSFNYNHVCSCGLKGGTCGTNLTWELDTAGVLSITGSGAMNNYSYTSYGGTLAPWNDYAAEVKSITMAEGITHIGDYAFDDCTKVTQVTIPASVKTIGTAIFHYCTGLQQINVASGNTAFASNGGVLFSKDSTVLHVFPANKGVSSYTIPNTVTTVADYAFYKCSSLTSIQFGSKVTTIGNHAFAASGLTQVTVPSTVTNFGYGAFSQCSYLTSATVPGSVKTLGSSTFGQCSRLTSVTLGTGITSIGDSAFDRCSSLKSIVIPAGVTTIGAEAFWQCTALKLVVIPSTVTRINNNAFHSCNSLDHILYTGKVPSYIGDNNESYMNKAVKHTYASGTEAVLNADGTVTCSLCACAHTGTHTYQDNADGKTHKSVCVSCGEVVSSGESHYFENSSSYCKCGVGTCGVSLTWTFDESTGTLTISGTGDMKDGTKPWYDWRSKIKTVIIGEGCTSIGSQAFATTADIASITSVSLPSTLKSIGYNAFYANAKLASVTLPASLESIEGYAFGQCDALTTLTIPDSVTTIGDKAFVGCDNLASISIGKALQTLDPEGNSIAHVFNNIDGLKTLTVSADNPYFAAQDNVLYTKDLRALVAFPMNRAGSELVVPYEVSRINSYAFNNPANLTKITFQTSAPVFDDNCLNGFVGEVHYNSMYSGWSTAAGKNYGGTVTWVDNGTAKYITGQCGYNATYSLNLSTGKLTISGTGAMFDYNFNPSNVPYAAYASQIKSVRVEDGITVIGNNAFRNLNNVTSVSLGNTVTEIGVRSFDGCSNLTNISLPAALKTIDEGAFERTGLTGVNLPSSLTYIGASAFKELPITKVTIPENVTYIGEQAFTQTEGNQTLKSIAFLGAPPTIGAYSFAGVIADATCYAENGWTTSHTKNYGGQLNWTIVDDCAGSHSYTYTILSGGKHTKKCANCTTPSVTEAHTFVSGVCACGQLSAGQCGDSAYWNYDASTKTLTVTGTGAMYDFGYNENTGEWWASTGEPAWLKLDVANVVIGSGITAVGRYNFYTMPISKVTLADTVTEVRAGAFQGTAAAIQNSRNLAIVGDSAFAGTSIDKVYNAVTVGESAFSSVTFTDPNVAVTGDVSQYAFFGSNIATLTLAENVKYVRDYSLSGCYQLTAIYFCCDKPDFSNNVYDGGGVSGNTVTYYRSSKATGFADSTAIWADEDHATVAGTPVPATCAQEGYTPYTCPYCSIQVKQDIQSASAHSHTYAADDTLDTITVGCANCNFEVVFTLIAPENTSYTGNPIEATVQTTASGEESLAHPEIVYTGSLVDGKPVNIGSYTASIIAGGKSVSVSFTVASLAATVTVGKDTTEYTVLSEALAAANAAPGSVLKLMNHASITQPLVITGSDVTLDLAGYTISNSKSSAVEVASGAKLTVNDSGTGGAITGTVVIGYFYKAGIDNKGTLILNGGKLSATGTSTPCALMNSGSFTMNGGELAGENSIYQASGSAVFNGGKVSAQPCVEGGSMTFHAGDYSKMVSGYIRGADITVYGGKFGSLPISRDTTTLTVYNGYFGGKLDAGTSTVTLHGGIFTGGVNYGSRSIQNMLAEGCTFLDQNQQPVTGYMTSYTGYLSVCDADTAYVAKHYLVSDGTTVFYSDLDTAIDRAERFGGYLTLLRDITGRNTPIVMDEGSFTLDFGGHSITGNVSSGALVQIDGCSITILSNDAKYTLTNTGSGPALQVSNVLTVGLNNCDIHAAGDAVVVSNAIVGMDERTNIVSTNGCGVVLKNSGNSSLVSNGGSITAKINAVQVLSGMMLIRQNVTLSSEGANVYCDQGMVNLERNNITVKGYTVQTSDTTGKIAFSSVSDEGYTEGVFVPYDSGYAVVKSGSFLYMKPLEVPQGTIDYFQEKIVGLKPNGNYRLSVDNFDTPADENGTLTIHEHMFGKEITIIERNALGDTQQTLYIPARPACPTGLSVEKETVYGKHDGVLTGVDSTMEYRMDIPVAETTWTKVTGTSLENLKPGAYSLRVAPTASSFASEAVGFRIEAGQYTAEHFQMALPVTRAYDASPRKASAVLPEGLAPENVIYYYNNGICDLETATDVGTYTVILVINDWFYGSYMVTSPDWSFDILKRTVQYHIDPIADQFYTGDFQYPVPQIHFENVPENCALEENKDYTLFYDLNMDPGTAKITVSPVEESNYTFEKQEVSFRILPCPIGVSFSLNAETLTYTGFPLEPEFTLNFSDLPAGRDPEKDRDYTVTYANNLNVGQATVTIAPVEGSEFTFESQTLTFTIEPCMVMPAIQGIPDQIYTGSAIEPEVYIDFEEGDFAFPPERDKDYTVTYSDNIQAGTATVTVAPVSGSNFSFPKTTATFLILPATLQVQIPSIDAYTYTGEPIVPELQITFRLNGKPVTLVENEDFLVEFGDNVNAGDCMITVSPVEGGNYDFPVTRAGFQIMPVAVKASLEPLGKYLYTGSAVCPASEVLFSDVPEGLTLREGVDYTRTYRNNIKVGKNAVLEIAPVEGGNFTFEPVSATFTISYGVKLPGETKVTLDGVEKKVEDGILWLDNEKAAFITTYTYKNAGSSDPHLRYPTGMTVRELRFNPKTGYSVRNVKELNNILQYGGTSIRITGNQGIRFITGIPTVKKNALTGSGLAGFKLVEYGTLMGWYEPGKNLIWGVNASSIAYSRSKGVDQVFHTGNGLVQFTGMLTDLDMKQATKDLMTRPYMVLERKDADGKTQRVVLYGGTIVRSIGYVAFQNKDVFQSGTSSYKFIWKILYHYDRKLYNKEYKG